MPAAIPSPASCCNPCESQTSGGSGTPGPQGLSAYQVAVADGFVGTVSEWLGSLVGESGENAYTALTAAFTQPAVNATEVATVVSSDWAAIGLDAFLEGGGYYEITAIPDATHITLRNRGYDANSAPGTIISIGARLTPAGEKGEQGVPGGGGGDLLSTNNLSDVDNADTSLVNLGGSVVGTNLFKVANPSAIRFLRVNANNTVSLLSDADQRTALGLEIGADVQAYDVDLEQIAGLASAADQVPYATGAGTWAMFTATSLGRSLLAQATAELMRGILGVLPRYGLLGSAIEVDLNTAGGDTSIAIASSRYRIDRITVENESIYADVATVGVFTLPAAGGTTIVADTGIALTSPDKFLDLNLSAAPTFNVLTNAVLYVHVGTAQGAPATANFWIFGWDFEL